MIPIADYWPDGQIDCKDYAVRNSVAIERMGYEPKLIVTKNHMCVMFEHGGNIYIFDNDRVYITSIRR